MIAIGAGAASSTISTAIGTNTNPTVPPKVSPLVKVMIVQGAGLGVLGLGIGLAMALPLFPPRPLATCVTGGLLGGLLAALVFPLAIGFLLPNANTEELMPEAAVGRLLWIGLFAGFLGITLTGLGKEQRKVRLGEGTVS